MTADLAYDPAEPEVVEAAAATDIAAEPPKDDDDREADAATDEDMP